MMANDECVRFASVCKQVSQIKSLDAVNDQQLHPILDQLNAFDYASSVRFVESQLANTMMFELFRLVRLSSSPHVVSKWCLLVSSIVAKQSVVVETQLLHSLVEYALEGLGKCATWMHSDLLMLLSALLYENVGRLEKFWDALVKDGSGILLRLAVTGSEGDVRMWALKCLQHLTMKSVRAESYLHEDLASNCFSVFLMTLKEPPHDSDPVAQCRVLMSCLRGLGNVIGCTRTCPPTLLGEVLAILKSYMFYGLPGQNAHPVSTKLYPSPYCQFVVPVEQRPADEEAFFSNNRITVQKRKTRRKRAARQKAVQRGTRHDEELYPQPLSPSAHQAEISWRENGSNLSKVPDEVVWSPSASSDSEYSDYEGSAVIKTRSLQAKVRRNAFNAFQTLIKVVPKRTMFGFWPAFLPDSPPSESPLQWQQTILTSMLKDPSPKVRTAALAALADLLDDSKQFLCLAEERTSPSTAFTPLSAMLASTIRELHRCLLLALLAESLQPITIQHLKCFSILVSNVPYHRLKGGLISRLLKHLIPFLHHKDVQVRVSCLNVVGCLLAIRPTLPEIDDVFSRSKDGEVDGADAEKGVPWIVSLCSKNALQESCKSLGGCQSSLTVRVESLQVLAIFAENHFPLIKCHLDVIVNLLLHIFAETDPILQQHGAKLLYSCGKSLAESLASETPGVCLQADGVRFWDSLLHGSFASTTSSSLNPSLQGTCCDCLSTIGSVVFESLPMPSQMLCLTLVLGLAKESEPPVRGSAIRCLGVFSQYPLLSEDIGFLMDVGECAVSGMNDAQFAVRFKSVWALGNLTDTLLNNREKEEFCGRLPSTFLAALLTAGVQSVEKDQDKIRCHAVRALGNLLGFLSSGMLENGELQRIACCACRSLCASLGASLMKVRWNACYALANVLRNSRLLRVAAGTLDLEAIFESLLSTLKCSGNFKVRINAVIALSAVRERQTYSNHFLDIWHHFLEALRTSYDAVAEFTEIKHRDNLCHQLCLGILTLARLLDPEDVAAVATPTLDCRELLQSMVVRWRAKLTTEKDLDDQKGLLNQVLRHLQSLPLTDDTDKECINFLKSLADQLVEEL